MQFQLFAFQPSTMPANAVKSIDARLLLDGKTGTLRFLLQGQPDVLLIPPENVNAGRVTGLWHHTCFELFLRDPVTGVYHELNVSPSGDWQCFSFTDTRTGQRESAAICPQSIVANRTDTSLLIEVELELEGIDRRPLVGVSAVIESPAGLAYFAPSHGEKPDFHNPSNYKTYSA